jgi:hypothetical protein
MQQQLVTYNGIGGGFYLGHTGGFVRGAQMFNERFIASWSKDSYLDYLEGRVTPGMDPTSQGSNVMSSLLGNMSLSAGSSSPAISSPRSPMRSPSSLNPDSGSKKNRHLSTSTKASSASRSPKNSMLSTSGSTAQSASAMKSSGKNIKFHIDDEDDVGDARIKPAELRKLLSTRPDIAEILYSYIKELNIDDTS